MVFLYKNGVNSLLLRLLTIIFFITAIALTGCKENPNITEVKQNVKEMMAAYVRKDIDGYMSYFLPDVLVNEDGVKELLNYKSYRKFVLKEFKASDKQELQYNLLKPEITITPDGKSSVSVAIEGTLILHANGSSKTRHLSMSFDFVKDEGKWKVSAAAS